MRGKLPLLIVDGLRLHHNYLTNETAPSLTIVDYLVCERKLFIQTEQSFSVAC